MTTTTTSASPSSEREKRPSAQVIPFPLRHTELGRFVAQEYLRRPEKGRVSRASYAEKVIAGNIERLKGFGVAPEHIAAEVASLESMFNTLSRSDTPEKVRA